MARHTTEDVTVETKIMYDPGSWFFPSSERNITKINTATFWEQIISSKYILAILSYLLFALFLNLYHSPSFIIAETDRNNKLNFDQLHPMHPKSRFVEILLQSTFFFLFICGVVVWFLKDQTLEINLIDTSISTYNYSACLFKQNLTNVILVSKMH